MLRIFGRMFDQHGPVFLAAAAAIVALIVLVVIMRRRRNGPKKPKPSKAEIAQEAALDMDMPDAMPEGDIALSMEDGDKLALEMDVSDEMGALADTDMPAPDQLDAGLSHQFDMADASIDELDDITIPKVGEAPPPKKSRFFSASWLHREHGDSKAAPAEMFENENIMAPDSKARDSAAECARLAEIERNMLALRELYEAGLIAPEIYALKAREFAGQAH